MGSNFGEDELESFGKCQFYFVSYDSFLFYNEHKLTWEKKTWGFCLFVFNNAKEYLCKSVYWFPTELYSINVL